MLGSFATPLGLLAFATLKVYSAELGKNQLYVGESMGSNVNPGLINHGLLIRGVFPQ